MKINCGSFILPCLPVLRRLPPIYRQCGPGILSLPPWVPPPVVLWIKLGRDLGIEEGYEAARLAAIRVIAELKSVVGDLDRIERIVKVTGYVNSAPDFGGQPKVINGASELFRNVFGEKGEHARVAFGTGALPDNAAVEIDVIAYVKD